jgi:hypothetical protein
MKPGDIVNSPLGKMEYLGEAWECCVCGVLLASEADSEAHYEKFHLEDDKKAARRQQLAETN